MSNCGTTLHNKLLFCIASTGFSHSLGSKVSDRQRAASSRETKEKRKDRVWIGLKHHHNLPGAERGPSVAHWSFHWQEPSQVPSKIYLSVLWCWHNVFLMSGIRLRIDEKALFLSFPSCFFLPWCQSVRQTSRQAEFLLKPISYLFKEVWILDWGPRPRWNRHLRVFIKFPIS